MNFEKLASVGTQEEIEKKVAPKRVADSTRVKDTNRQKRLRLKKVKDEVEEELMETETTDEAIQVVTDFLEEQPPEDVVQAVVEVLGEKIDELVEVNDSLRKRNLRLSDSLKKKLALPAKRKMSRTQK